MTVTVTGVDLDLLMCAPAAEPEYNTLISDSHLEEETFMF